MKKFLVCLFILLTQNSFSLSIKESKEILKKSTNYYNQGKFKNCIEGLEKIHLVKDFDSYQDIKKAYEILIVSYFMTGKKNKSSHMIKEMLKVDNGFSLPPFTTPPEIIAMLETEKEELREKQKLVDEPVEYRDTLKKIDYKYPVSNINLFLPFGVNHFSLGNTKRGVFYGTWQSLSLAANITFFWVKKSCLKSFSSTELKTHKYQKRYDLMQNLQIASLISLGAAFTVSVIDAWISQG